MKESYKGAESIVNRETPKTVLEYLENKHRSIVNDYCIPDSNEFCESCTLIAVDIAEMLLKEGRRPYIMMITEDVHENGFIHPKKLSPIIYNGRGRVKWGAHQICCCDGIAYDPIVGAPINLEKYSKTVFGEEIQMKILIPQDKIEEFVNR